MIELFKQIKLLPALLLLVFLISCNTVQEIQGISSVIVQVPDGINLSEKDFLNVTTFPDIGKGSNTMIIVPYSYSPFVEVIAYSGVEIINKRKPGKLKVLIRIMDNDKVLKVIFIEVDGEGKENLLSLFSEKVKVLLYSKN